MSRKFCVLFSLLPMLTSLILFSFSANAKVFRNAYISFEMPDTWKCILEQTEWVCRSDPDKFQKEAKEAIIILTAKEVGPTDSIPQYEQHLNSPITMIGRNGSTAPSKIQYKAKKVQINDQVWIEGLHLGSEVNNYFTRYLATIKEKIAVLVTFSAHTQFYAKYSNDFYKTMMSMRVIAAKNLLPNTNSGGGQMNPGEIWGPPSDGGSAITDPLPSNSGRGGNVRTYLGLALLLGGIGIYLFMRSRKNK